MNFSWISSVPWWYFADFRTLLVTQTVKLMKLNEAVVTRLSCPAVILMVVSLGAQQTHCSPGLSPRSEKKSASRSDRSRQMFEIDSRLRIELYRSVFYLHSLHKYNLIIYKLKPSLRQITLRTGFLCVLCGSQNKQPLFPYTALTDWFV